MSSTPYKHVAIKCILCPITSGTILVDRLAETGLGVGDTLQEITESITNPNSRPGRQGRTGPITTILN